MSRGERALKNRLSGYLYLTRAASDIQRALYDADPLVLPRGTRESALPEFLFPSREPCFDEDLAGVAPPYLYPFGFLALGWGCAFLTLNRDVATHLERTLFKAAVNVQLSFTTVRVQSILKHILDSEESLTVSFVHAHTKSNKAALSSLSYYGPDLRKSKRFLDDVDSFRAQTVRITDRVSGTPFVTISVDGFLSFPENRLADVRILLTIFHNLGHFVGEKHRTLPPTETHQF